VIPEIPMKYNIEPTKPKKRGLSPLIDKEERDKLWNNG
jgi:hypothetical protein